MLGSGQQASPQFDGLHCLFSGLHIIHRRLIGAHIHGFDEADGGHRRRGASRVEWSGRQHSHLLADVAGGAECWSKGQILEAFYVVHLQMQSRELNPEPWLNVTLASNIRRQSVVFCHPLLFF